MLSTEDRPGQMVRVYAHCARTGQGAVVVFGFNMMDKDSQIFPIGEIQPIEEYILRPVAGNITSQSIMLNNHVLNIIEGKTMPSLQPNVTSGSQILIEPGTIGFWVLPKAGNENCT